MQSQIFGMSRLDWQTNQVNRFVKELIVLDFICI